MFPDNLVKLRNMQVNHLEIIEKNLIFIFFHYPILMNRKKNERTPKMSPNCCLNLIVRSYRWNLNLNGKVQSSYYHSIGLGLSMWSG
jgi:hypothetical protein